MLAISHEAGAIIKGVVKLYYMNKYPETKKTYYEPRRYLGANVGKFDLLDGSGTVWFMPGVDNIKEGKTHCPQIYLRQGGKLMVGQIQ